MILKGFVALLAAIPAIVAASPTHSIADIPGYGDGGKYGFKSCTDKGKRPGKVSCINFDTIKTDPKTGLADIPKDYTGLIFSPQFTVIDVKNPASQTPPNNENSAASSPNALIGSRYNPKDKNDKSPATFSVEDGTFDLFGFYIQPIDSPPPGASVYIQGYIKGEGDDPLGFSTSFRWGSKVPIYFDTERDAGPEMWDKLTKVEVWSGYGRDDVDWEFFIDDIWLRWGKDTESAIQEQHGEELK